MSTLAAPRGGTPGRDRAPRASSAAAVDRCLRRITTTDPPLRAVLAVARDAVTVAERSDRRRDGGRPLGPMDGVPVLVKDNIDVAGLPCTAGSRLLATAPPPADADVVGRLRAAGTVVLGKTNLSEWANFRDTRSTEGWSAVGGQTRNPHDVRCSPWGSSSGSAVAVATGMAPLALGTETDGSVVGPAGVTGVVGLKPEVGLLPMRGVVPVSPAQDAVGVLAWSVSAAALCVAVLGGADPVPVPAADPDGLRLGVWRVPGMPDASDAVLDAVLARLRAAGAELTPVDPGLSRGTAASAALALHAEFADAIGGYLRDRACGPTGLDDLVAGNRADPEELRLFGQDVFERAAGLDPDERDVVRDAGRRARARTRARLDGLRAEAGVVAIVSATNPPAWRIDPERGDPAVPAASGPAALAGFPVVSVPAGRAGALPVGVSVFGPPTLRELLPVALAVERCADGARRATGGSA